MPRRIFHLGLLGLILVGGATGYTLRRNLGSEKPEGPECMRCWLYLSGSQCRGIGDEDPGFHSEVGVLAQSLHDRQEMLIAQVSDGTTSADRIRTQAQAVLEAHQALSRRIVRHLLVVRRQVDVRQCARLNELCAETMRRSEPPDTSAADRQQQGAGGPWGQDRQRRRYGRLAPALGLTVAQQAMAAQADPNYESDAARLTHQVCDAHLLLAETLQDTNAPDSRVQQVLEDFIALHAELELRTVDYILSIRPTLGPEQQQRLVGLSQRGRRWRGGRL